ncbi:MULTISPECIES: hypothetical protein [Kribbella]|uniref:DUF8094 domain-containing protein n=1 Tax=Kribbella karoonensis TaxID=324851 RepID=A0ABN2E4R3_9ACTN
MYSGEQHLSSKGLAIATTPELLNRHGPVLHVDVRSAKNQPVFVGVARDFDVASYLKGTGHTRLVQVQYPIALSTEEEKGTAGPLAAPATLDWWVTKANGSGPQSIAWPIEDGPYDVVIMNADGKTAPDVQAELGIEIPKAFRTALAVFAGGILLLALGILLILLRRRSVRPQAPGNIASGTPQAGALGDGRRSSPGVRRVVGLALVLGLVAGCSAIPQADTVTSLTRPAISDARAAAVIKHYNDLSDKANSSLDAKPLTAVETGNVLRQSQAWYKIARAEKAKPGGTSAFLEPVIGSPQFGTYPMRFVSSSGIAGDKEYRHVGVWERATAGSPWMLVFSAGVKTAAKLPDITSLRVATRADDTKLAAGTQGAASSLATYRTDGPKSARAAAFQPNADITELFADIAKDKAEQAKERGSVRGITNTFSSPAESPAFITKSGTAMVFVSLTQDYTLLAGSNWQFWWESVPEAAFSPATAKYQSGLTRTTIHDTVLLIPPKGQGKIRIASFQSQVVDAGGY